MKHSVFGSVALASASAVFLLAHCIGDPPIPPLASVDASAPDGSAGGDAAARDSSSGDATNGRDAGDGGGEAGRCAVVTQCSSGDGCCPAGCTSKTDTDCPVAVCGDGVVQPGEACDDGNKKNGDTCDPTCLYANTLEKIAGFPGGPGYADSDAGANVRFAGKGGLATDGTVLYYADPGGTIRQIDPTSGGSVTIAGKNGDTTEVNDAGVTARFQSATALTYLDTTATIGEKDLFVLDGTNIRRINVRDPAAPVSTFLSAITNLASIAAGPNQFGPHLFSMADSTISSWRVLAGGAGSDAQLANQSQLNSIVYNGPQASWGPDNCHELAFASYDAPTQAATLYVACPDTILRVVQSPAGATTVALFAGVPNSAGCADAANPLQATLTHPVGLSVDATGTLYFSDCGKVRKIDTGGVGTYAGMGAVGYGDATNGDPKTAQFSSLGSTAIVGSSLFAVDGPRIRTITKTATSTLASGTGDRGLVLDPTGRNSSYPSVVGLGTDATGTIYALVGAAPRVVKVDPQTGASTLAFVLSAAIDAGAAKPQAMTLMGTSIFVAYDDGKVRRFGLDGSGGTVFATANAPYLTNDGTNLYFIDPNRTIGQIDASGNRTVVCGKANANGIVDGSGSNAQFEQPEGIAYVGNGTLYVADYYVGFGDILLRRVDIGPGKVTTVAGNTTTNAADTQTDGVGADAGFGAITMLASDGVSLFAINQGFGYKIPLLDGPTVRQIDPATYSVTTMIGRTGQFAATPGVGTSARINTPKALVFDPVSKTLLLADESSLFRIR